MPPESIKQLASSMYFVVCFLLVFQTMDDLSWFSYFIIKLIGTRVSNNDDDDHDNDDYNNLHFLHFSTVTTKASPVDS